MSKFTNTQRKNTIDSLVDGFKKRLDNPYYLTMHNPTMTTYYNTVSNHTTLDEGSKLDYAEIGKDSPIKYNEILDFIIFGLDRISVQMDNGEFGLESDPIQGEGIILPNTIIPVPNDYFSINYLNKSVLFRVLTVTPDTLNNDANLYKIEFKLDQIDINVITQNIVDTSRMISDNVGSGLHTIIRNEEYDFIDYLETITSNLKSYYMDLFYSDKVESFIWRKNDYNFYDPYMTEFLIRNSILKSNEKYIFICQQCFISNTFVLDYSKSFFRAVEVNKLKDTTKYLATATIIDEPLSILTSRIEDYYKINYAPSRSLDLNVIESYDPNMIASIKNNKLLPKGDYRNIIVKYFLNQEITKKDISALEDIDLDQSQEYYYTIPIIIFILENNILQLLKKN